jgi:DNA invertase Pin-like site-specific DNA recombinase
MLQSASQPAQAEPPRPGRIIAYYRVSTDKQGQSRLGLEAQQAAVEGYRVSRRCDLIREYEEVETGKKNDRPELLKALAHARRSGATLVIAKLDRLTRNTRFLLTLVESGAPVAFCELPDVPPGAMGKFFLTQMAAVAELERGLISERTKGALAIYRKAGMVAKKIRERYRGKVPRSIVEARGGKLGAQHPECRRLSPEDMAKGRAASAACATTRAVEAYSDIAGWMAELKAEGKSLRAIARALNDEGHTTRRGKPWNPVQVRRVLARAASGGSP